MENNMVEVADCFYVLSAAYGDELSLRLKRESSKE